MELRQLRQFAMVANTLNFRRAAEQLHMAQPPLSVAMRRLEEELGVRLFERKPRGVLLTAAGQAALRCARQCLALTDEMALTARAAAGGESGLLRVGFVGSATYSLLPRLLPAFCSRYPGVELVLHESTNLDILAGLEAHQLDIGLVRYPTVAGTAPIGRAPARSLQFEVIERDVLCAVLPAQHPLALQRRVTLAELAREPFIDYASSKVPGLHALVLLAFQQAGLTPQVTQQATQVQTVLSLVESGMGVALVPSVTSRLAPRGLAFRPVKGLSKTAGIAIALAYDSLHESATASRFRSIAATLAAPTAVGLSP